MYQLNAILSDVPKSNLAEDEFNRKCLVELISNSIGSTTRTSHPCICYSIYGRWGEGKTTVLNFVRDHLVVEYSDSVRIVQFNPCIVTGENELIREFFSSVLENDIWDDEIRKILSKYAKLLTLSLRYISSLNTWTSFISNIFEDNKVLFKKRSLSSQKRIIIEHLRNSPKHLVVFIDDVDRLDSDEVRALFRVIRQVADFPNTVYVMAMDPEIVSKSLSGFCGGSLSDGRNFIDKIVQVPIPMPAITAKSIENKLFKELRNVIDEDSIDDNELFLLSNNLSQILLTPRQVIRYINQLNFSLSTLKDEVCVRDLCVLEAIKVLDLDAYWKVYQNKESLLRKSKYDDLPLEKYADKSAVENRFNAAIDYIASGFEHSIQNNIKTILVELFRDGSTNKMALIDERRVNCEIFFPLYFIQSVPEGVVSKNRTDLFITEIKRIDNDNAVVLIDSVLKQFDFKILNSLSLLALYKASPTDVSNTIMNLCKSIALSERSHGINESLVMVDDCVVTVFSLLEEYAFGRRDLREEDRYSVCSNILCDIYRCADIEFCLGLNGHIVRHFSATTYLNVSHAQYLIDRYKRLSYNEHLRYGWVVLYSLYYTWNVSDRNDFLTYLGNLIQMEEGDYLLKLIVKFCGSDGRDYHNCEELILLINDECVVSSMIEKAVSQDKDKIYEETFNVIALNYKATLQNSRKK